MSGSPAHGSSFVLSQQISYAAARAGHDIDPHDVPLEPSRGGRPGTPARRPDTPARHPDWISSLPLRLAAGDPDAAAHHATRLVEALAPAVDADVMPRGLLGIRLDDPALVTLALDLPRGWADRAPGPAASTQPATTQPATTRRTAARTPTNPRYAAQLAHSRLCRLAEQPPGERLPPHDVLVRLVDAWRVRDRLAADGRVHHLTDWLAAYGASVLVWTREPRPRDLDHRVVVAARDALADGLRASGATPLERL